MFVPDQFEFYVIFKLPGRCPGLKNKNNGYEPQIRWVIVHNVLVCCDRMEEETAAKDCDFSSSRDNRTK